MLMDGA
jgi:hypothetical protein